jgi:hypothetical protein
MLWEGHVAHMWEMRNIYMLLVGKPEVKRPFGRAFRTLEDNIEMVLRETGYGDVDWIVVAQDRNRWRASEYVKGGNSLNI